MSKRPAEYEFSQDIPDMPGAYSVKRSRAQTPRRANYYSRGWMTLRSPSSTVKGYASLSKKVNRILRSVEKKFARVEGTTDLVSTGAASFDGQVFAVAPTTTVQDAKAIVLAQGDGQANITGNKVTTEKNIFSFVATLKPWNASTNANPRPLYLTYWVVSVRGGSYSTVVADVVSQIKSRFFNSGNSFAGFSDSVLDQIRTVNDDVFILHEKKTFKLGNASTFASGAGGATPTSAQGYTNNDFSMIVKFDVDLTKYTPKTIRYNDNDATQFGNQKWIFFTMQNCDGSAISASVPVELWYNHHYMYSDM